MKNIYKFLTLIIACMLTVNLSATYYIVGNGHDHGTEWCSGKEWGNDGGLTATPLVNDEISCPNLPAGWYEFKITTGTWSDQYDYSALDVANSSPMHKTYGNGGNICFRLQAAADVTIKMVDGKVVLLIDREYTITGNGHGDWLAGHWWWSKDDASKLNANLSRTYYNLPAGDYRFKVKENVDDAWNDDCTWGYAHFDSENSNAGGDWDGDDHNIGFTLSSPSDVTISIVNNKIRLNVSPVYFVTGELCPGGWAVADVRSRLNSETHDITFSGVAAGTYKFMITNGTWGVKLNYNNVDKTTSSNGIFDNGGDDHNIKISLDRTADVTITLDPSTSKITVESSYGYFSCNKYSVTGWGMFAEDWKDYDVATEMTLLDNGTYQYILHDKYLTEGNYGYRVIGDHSWNVQYPISTVSNTVVTIPEDGTYTIVFSLNPADDAPSYVAYLQLDVTISAYGYSTFYSDKAWTLPDGLTATIFTQVNGTALIGESIDLIPANTGVLLSGTANATYTLLQTTTDDSYSNNLFRGTTSAETIADNGKVHYILGTKSGECGLYWPSGTEQGVGAFENKAGKAYLEIEPSAAPAGAPGFILRGKDVVTAVEDMPVNEDGEYYDLLGRKVANPQPGNLYICNGKKILLF